MRRDEKPPAPSRWIRFWLRCFPRPFRETCGADLAKQYALDADDFTEVGGSGHPDFGPAGAEIHFGYLRFNSTTGTSFTTTHAIDNWSVEVIPVPEPTGAWMLASGVAALLVLRRRRARVSASSRGATASSRGSERRPWPSGPDVDVGACT
jgi:hypothetical protein